jgi:flagellar basal-body rod modification protein FlgD
MEITSTLPAASGTQSAGNAQAIPQGALDNQTFMKLLLVQLQNQDPFQPMDPSEMVNQMVQLNMLNELIQIRQGLDGA